MDQTMPATIHDIERRMSDEAYEREREAIRETYGDSNAEALALRDQALAKLYLRSGWTQEELAKKENVGRPRMTQRLLFGRFLAFVTTGNIPRNLSERRFRDYWSRTEGDERDRFREVRRLMEAETTLRRPQRSGVGARIAELADGEWHTKEEIALHVGEPVESLQAVLDNIQNKHTNGIGMCEKRRWKSSYQYRMRKAGRKIDFDVLMEELKPVIKGLKAEGRKNMTTMSPPTVAELAIRLERILERLAEKPATDD
jgi:hypothetical protein